MNETSFPDSAFGGSTGAPHDPFQAAKQSAIKAAEELRQAASQKATELRQAAETRAQQFKTTAEQKAHEIKEKAGEFREYADRAFDDARECYADLRTEAERLTREKPLQALAVAFGAGVFLGLLLRR